MDIEVKCCPCVNRGKCGSCVCKKTTCTNCDNPMCKHKATKIVRKTTSKRRPLPYQSSSRNIIPPTEIMSINDALLQSCKPVEDKEKELSTVLLNRVQGMYRNDLKDTMKLAKTKFSNEMKTCMDSSSYEQQTEIYWCTCRKSDEIEDQRNLKECITSNPTFTNVSLRRDIEVPNILNWSHQTNLDPNFENKTFRNQAYRNFILWQYGKLGAGERRPLPASAYASITN